jgi:hypothetical protein
MLAQEAKGEFQLARVGRLVESLGNLKSQGYGITARSR